MRVLVASDTIGALGSAVAGRTLAAAWSARGHHVDVVPAGEAGQGFVTAAAEQYGLGVHVEVDGDTVTSSALGTEVAVLGVERDEDRGAGLPLTRSSVVLGHALGRLLDRAGDRPRRILIDLAGVDVHDAGAGLLGALGAVADRTLDGGVAGLAGLGRFDLGPAAARLEGVELVGVVPPAERGDALLGLRGITSRRGRGAGLDPAVLLQVDQDLTVFARLAAADVVDRPGAGACGGLGFAVLALGGSLRTGTEIALDTHDALDAHHALSADLVVTGCSAFDFGSRGGGVVATLARRAAEYLAPCVVVAGEVLIGAREMRALGVEAAYPVHRPRPDGAAIDVTVDELATTAQRVARSWSW